MTLAAPRVAAGELRDEFGRIAPLDSSVAHHGNVFDLVVDRVDLGEGGVVVRDYLRHPGAVIVLAMRSRDGGGDDVYLVRQYRHALGATEWELPAGLLDVDGEAPWVGAARELAEEADLTAKTWHTLTGYAASPGATDETTRIYLARDLADVPPESRHTRGEEELAMTGAWADLDDVVDAALDGRIGNTGLLIGALAAQAARARGWSTLRPHDEPWPQHPRLRDED